MHTNVRRVGDLGLDRARPERILDLGCGMGYFLYICKHLDHTVLGLDLDESPMFNEMVTLLGIPRVICRIEPFVPLPAFGEEFDLITAHQVCFNGHKSNDLWQVAEWKFFLNDLARHLKLDGRVALQLNHETDGTLYTDELKKFFERLGATVDGQRVTFDPLLVSARLKSKTKSPQLFSIASAGRRHP
jgi:cyclopropane fatty-acyl-phospholipid synthase-like methyltransferase